MKDHHPADLSPRFVPELDQALEHILRAAVAFRIRYSGTTDYKTLTLLWELDHLCGHALVAVTRLEQHAPLGQLSLDADDRS